LSPPPTEETVMPRQPRIKPPRKEIEVVVVRKEVDDPVREDKLMKRLAELVRAHRNSTPRK